MALVDGSAYPRFPPTLSTRDLTARYTRQLMRSRVILQKSSGSGSLVRSNSAQPPATGNKRPFGVTQGRDHVLFCA